MAILEKINGFVWGIPAIVLLMAVGIRITWKTRMVQLRLLPDAMKLFFRQIFGKSQEESQFRSLCTALAATVGTGNIVGVAGAISIGGPGAIFWMWISGLIGMGTKFAEATLATCYRRKNSCAETVGGPMYIISLGLDRKYHCLAGIYAFLGVIAAFGVGNATQINAVFGAVRSVSEQMGWAVQENRITIAGIGIAGLVAAMVSGGAKKIADVVQLLVPFASAVYILLCVGVLVAFSERIPTAIQQIIVGAFTPNAVTGGLLGGMYMAFRSGVSRGVFSNEAGMGTAAIAHAQAQVEQPAQQGLMGIVEVFVDTMLICTLTACAILVSGCPIPYGHMAGAELAGSALSAVYGPWVGILLCVCLGSFAFATILGWGMYAGRCLEFLLGRINWKWFALCQGIGVILGVLLKTDVIWTFAEIVNGLMAIPNLIALWILTDQVAERTAKYTQTKKRLDK